MLPFKLHQHKQTDKWRKKKSRSSYHSVEFVVQISHCLGEEKINLLQMSYQSAK